jgi:hypothetical protein
VPTFLTGVAVLDPKFIESFPINGRGWTLELRTGTHWEVFSGHATDGGKSSPCPEIAIDARSDQRANSAMSLVAAAVNVVQGSDFIPFEANLIEEGSLTAEQIRRRAPIAVGGIPEACLLAARASWRRSRMYALARLHFSMVMFSTHLMDRHPDYARAWPKSDDPLMHVRFAQAIVLAYGAIEELGLHIRASNARPSMRNGVWNPPVLADLEAHLRRAGLNPYMPIMWEVRGRKTLLERERPTRLQRRAPWTSWPDVRDVSVALVDAIAHVSWLRSRVSAHAAPHQLRSVLSPYDVANAQHVAREVILGSRWAGIFRLWFGSTRRRAKV